MGFTIFRTTVTILICCFLVMLFLLPSAILTRFTEQADALLESAENALLSDDTDAAESYCAALYELMREQMPVLDRFLNHESVDALHARIVIADFALRAGDPGTTAEALAEARSILVCLEAIEHFSWNNLL